MSSWSFNNSRTLHYSYQVIMPLGRAASPVYTYSITSLRFVFLKVLLSQKLALLLVFASNTLVLEIFDMSQTLFLDLSHGCRFQQSSTYRSKAVDEMSSAEPLTTSQVVKFPGKISAQKKFCTSNQSFSVSKGQNSGT